MCAAPIASPSAKRTPAGVSALRAVIQRVSSASVSVAGNLISEINRGLLALIGIEREDGDGDCEYIAQKISGMRIFYDVTGNMNLAVNEVNGEVLAISQFTLFADARKGRRPSFIAAAASSVAQPLFERTVHAIRRQGILIKTGVFGAQMQVALINDGPVTVLLDSKKSF